MLVRSSADPALLGLTSGNTLSSGTFGSRDSITSTGRFMGAALTAPESEVVDVESADEEGTGDMGGKAKELADEQLIEERGAVKWRL